MKSNSEIVTELDDEQENVSLPLEEKKRYKLVVSDEKTTPNHTPLPKFEPPYLQLIGEMKDTQVQYYTNMHIMCGIKHLILIGGALSMFPSDTESNSSGSKFKMSLFMSVQ